MLGRAATNAYSWWWASHVRTKQSKWLEQSLQDMEEIVAETLKIIDDSGDSFAQRAEMYYRKRPELINFVEEAFRAFRSLAEKYDHLSKELQSANRTIATVFPEQVHYRIDEDEDEDEDEESFPETNSSSTNPNNEIEKQCNIPKPPSIPKKHNRSPSMLLSKKGTHRRSVSTAKPVPNLSVQSSGLSKVEALAEIDKLQKDILALQTEKEFVRSLYENSYEKYWDIEDKITGMQKRVCNLQDEFNISTIIEDNDARALMAATALNSCKETLDKLKEVQVQSSEEAREAYQKFKEAHHKFENLRSNFVSKQTNQRDEETDSKSKDEEEIELILEENMHVHDELVSLQERIKEKLEEDSGNSLTMTVIAEMIDELVSKVVSLETAVTSQNSLVKRLKSEADELQTNIQSLEEDKEILLEDSENSHKRMKELEEELKRVKALNKSVEKQDKNLQTFFHEANLNLEHLSGRLKNVKLDEDFEKHVDELLTDNLEISNDVKEDHATNISEFINEVDKSSLKENIDFKTEVTPELTQQDKVESLDVETGEEKDQTNLNQMLVSGSDDREKIMLEEYTSVLKNYNDVTDKLNDTENKNRNSIFELALQVRELKDVVATKDEEINTLQKKLTFSERNLDESPRTPITEEAPLENAAQGDNMQGTEVPSSDIGSTSFGDQHHHVENTGNIDIRTRLILVREKHSYKNRSLSPLEKKIRSEIDALLEENLEFWLRFSTSVHQIQKFQESLQDLKGELRKIKHNNFVSESKMSSKAIQSEIKPIFRHLREIRTELSLWLEHNDVLQDELQARHPSLCRLQDEIASAANPDSSSKKGELSEHQAAKFQGEVLNMKQESNKVSTELEECLNYVKGLKFEVEKILEELNQTMGGNNNDMKHSASRAKLPLKSFLFGIKLKNKKQRQSMFACVNPTLQKQYSDLAAADDAPI